MKPTTLKRLAAITALLLAPVLGYAGGTNSAGDPTTGYKNDPGSMTEPGDMGAQGTAQPAGEPAPTKVDDSQLAKQVKDAIKQDAMLKKLDIDVKSQNGTVTLSGDAKDVRWQGRAIMVANSVYGVKKVQNNLTIGNEKK